MQGVVTYMSPVEAFATGIKIVLDRSILRPLMAWFYVRFKRQTRGHASLVSEKLHWSVDISHSEFILIPWSAPKRTLIAWFHFDPGRKCFYRWCVCDYPLTWIYRMYTWHCHHNTKFHLQVYSSFVYGLCALECCHYVVTGNIALLDLQKRDSWLLWSSDSTQWLYQPPTTSSNHHFI